MSVAHYVDKTAENDHLRFTLFLGCGESVVVVLVVVLIIVVFVVVVL